MIKEGLEYILKRIDAAKPVEQVDGRDYNNCNGTLTAIKEPSADTMMFSTLTGLVQWAILHAKEAIENKNETGSEPYFVVDNFRRVELYSPVFGGFKQRALIATAFHEFNPFPYGVYMDTASFITNTQTHFEMVGDMVKLLAIVGKVKEEAIRENNDDGITQSVVTKQGITRANVDLPNPVMLKPFKTFTEIDSPEVPHVFRGKSGLEWALFESDDSLWKKQAMEKIEAWLKNNSKFEVYA